MPRHWLDCVGKTWLEPPQRLLVRIKDADEPDEQDVEAMLTAALNSRSPIKAFGIRAWP